MTGLRHVPADGAAPPRRDPARAGAARRRRRRRAVAAGGCAGARRSGAAAGVLGLVAFCVLAAAGLPILGRYLLLPASILAIFGAAGALGWLALPAGDPRRRAVAGLRGARRSCALLVFAPGQVDRIRQERDALRIQDAHPVRPRAIVATAAARRLPAGHGAQPPPDPPAGAVARRAPHGDPLARRTAPPRRGAYLVPANAAVAKRLHPRPARPRPAPARRRPRASPSAAATRVGPADPRLRLRWTPLTQLVSECILTPRMSPPPPPSARSPPPRSAARSVLAAAARVFADARLLRHADDRGRQGGRHLAGLPLPPVPDQGRPRRWRCVERCNERIHAAFAGRGGRGARPAARTSCEAHGRRLRASCSRDRDAAAAPAPRPRRRRRRSPRSATPIAPRLRRLVELVERETGAHARGDPALLRPRDAAQRPGRHRRADARRPWAERPRRRLLSGPDAPPLFLPSRSE